MINVFNQSVNEKNYKKLLFITYKPINSHFLIFFPDTFYETEGRAERFNIDEGTTIS